MKCLITFPQKEVMAIGHRPTVCYLSPPSTKTQICNFKMNGHAAARLILIFLPVLCSLKNMILMKVMNISTKFFIRRRSLASYRA